MNVEVVLETPTAVKNIDEVFVDPIKEKDAFSDDVFQYNWMIEF